MAVAIVACDTQASLRDAHVAADMSTSGGDRMGLTRGELEEYATKSREHFERLLKEFVEIPSVSAEPDRRKDLERCAELGAATIRDFGGQAEIHRVPGGPPVVLGSFESGEGSADRHGLQSSRRRAGLAGDRALADGAVHVHAAGRHLLRPGHHRRQGPGALGAVRGPRRARRRGAGEHQGAVGAGGGGRLAPLRGHAARASAPAAETDAVVVSDTVWVSRGAAGAVRRGYAACRR